MSKLHQENAKHAEKNDAGETPQGMADAGETPQETADAGETHQGTADAGPNPTEPGAKQVTAADSVSQEPLTETGWSSVDASDVTTQLLQTEANGDLSFQAKPENPTESDRRSTKQKHQHRKVDKTPHECVAVSLERQVSGDFSTVPLVSFKRSRSKDASTKLDLFDDEGEDSSDYGEVSSTWVTSFWTQFTVLNRRTFKQSLPEILSKLNFIQVRLTVPEERKRGGGLEGGGRVMAGRGQGWGKLVW